SGSPTRATAVPARSTRKATAQQTGRIGITCPQLATTAPKGDLSTGLWIGELSIVNLDGPNDSVGLGHISELRCMSGGGSAERRCARSAWRQRCAHCAATGLITDRAKC